MCRALKVLCAAPDRERLVALKRATVSADWELTAGATEEDAALAQLEAEHPHVVVVAGGLEGFVRRARERRPFLRIVTDRSVPGATVVVSSLDEVRAAVKGLPRPGGPVG
jgi:hypothetical protein